MYLNKECVALSCARSLIYCRFALWKWKQSALNKIEGNTGSANHWDVKKEVLPNDKILCHIINNHYTFLYVTVPVFSSTRRWPIFLSLSLGTAPVPRALPPWLLPASDWPLCKQINIGNNSFFYIIEIHYSKACQQFFNKSK